MGSPVSIIRRASRVPTARGSSALIPQPAASPIAAWVSANRARSEAMRNEHDSASSNAPV
jgi:hypothetical protein